MAIKLFTFTGILFVFLFVSCGPTEKEKAEALRLFMEKDYHFKDTVLRYTIDSSHLKIIFPNEPEYQNWIVEASLRNIETGQDVYLGNATKTVKNRVITFDNVHLDPDSTSKYEAWLSMCPNEPKKVFISKPFGNIRSVWTEKDTSERYTLYPDSYWNKAHYVKFNHDVLVKFNQDVKKYCLDQFEQEMTPGQKK
jgi:hypothetical protein